MRRAGTGCGLCMVDTTILIGVIVGSSAALVLLVILVLTFYQEIWRVYMTPLWRDVVAFCTGTEQRNNTGGNVVSTEAEHTFLYDASDLGLPLARVRPRTKARNERRGPC